MTDDLIDRLFTLGRRLDAFGGRFNSPYCHPWGVNGFHTCGDAIREIELLRARVAELEAERAPAP